MPQVTKPYTYSSGTTISSTQVSANEDAIINAVNALDEDNFDAGTQLPNSILAEIQPDIVDAHADTAAEYLTATTPGTTAGLLATTTAVPALLTDELERLRYRLLANNHLTSTVFIDASSVQQEAGWVESSPFGPQLFLNNGFEVKTSATASDAPDNWTLVGTPTSLVITAPGLAVPLAGLYKKALRITCTGSGEGVEQTLTGLKASTKYLIGAAFAKVSGAPAFNIVTTGGLGSGAYKNLNTTAGVAATVSYSQAIVQTTTTATPLVVQFLNSHNAADVIDLYQVWAYELSDLSNLGPVHIPMQTATDTSDSTYPTTWTGSADAWRTDTITSLSLTQYIPGPGYRARYEVTVPYTDIDAADAREGCRVYGAILLTIDGGATNVVSGPVCQNIRNETGGQDTAISNTLSLRYVTESLTPGSSYAFAFRLGVWDGSDYEQVSVPSTLGLLQMEARATLVLERL